jgi:hypothetical protein
LSVISHQSSVISKPRKLTQRREGAKKGKLAEIWSSLKFFFPLRLCVFAFIVFSYHVQQNAFQLFTMDLPTVVSNDTFAGGPTHLPGSLRRSDELGHSVGKSFFIPLIEEQSVSTLPDDIPQRIDVQRYHGKSTRHVLVYLERRPVKPELKLSVPGRLVRSHSDVPSR